MLAMKTTTLTTTCPFTFTKEKKVGHMRGDYANGSLANVWVPTGESFTALTLEEKKEIQSVCNQILFETFNSFDKIVDFCEAEGYGNEKNLFTQSEHFDYWIRLNPVKSDYCIYVHTYTK